MAVRTRPTRPRPSDAGRNAVRRQVSALPAEWAQIDALARRLASRGYDSNVSATLRACVQAILNAEADGLCAIDERGIRFLGPGTGLRSRPG